MENNKDNVLFWRDWDEAIRTLPEQEQAEAYHAVIDYAMDGTPYCGSNGAVKMLLHFLSSRIDAARASYDAICEKNRANGQKGGRPRKNPENPVGYFENPENPVGYLGSEKNPEKPDKGTKDIGTKDIGTEDIGYLKKNSKNPDGFSEQKEKKFDFRAYVITMTGVPDYLIDDWLLVRKNKRATNTKTAADALLRECDKAGISPIRGIELCVENSWQSFQAKYLHKENKDNGTYIDPRNPFPVPDWGNTTEEDMQFYPRTR